MAELDPEITAITKISEALSGLEPAIIERVLRWAIDKFGVTSIHRQDNSAHKAMNDEGSVKRLEQESFSDFASFYDAANPRTEAEKALVAGYWLQVLQGNPDWDSQTANTDL